MLAVFLESLRRIKQRGRGEKVQKRRVKGYFRIFISSAVYAPLENDDDDDDDDHQVSTLSKNGDTSRD